MGYTRYFSGIKVTKELAEIANIIISLSDVDIYGPLGTGQPIVNDETIAINGNAKTNEDYETFYIDQSGEWNFCKTARKPYDEVVGAILLAAKGLNPSCEISSDGSNGDDGLSLYTRALSRTLNNDIYVEDDIF